MSGNELPQARGAAHRVGKGLVGALHHRQQRELQRHAARLDLGDDVVHVALGALEYPLQIIRVVLEPGELLIDRRLLHLVEGEAGAHAVEQIVVVLAVVMLPFARHGERGRGARPQRSVRREASPAPWRGRHHDVLAYGRLAG